MAETLYLPESDSRSVIYEALFPQMEALLSGESDTIANMANFCAALKEAFGFFWVGFYLVKEGELVLGPFQGSIACMRIPFDKGVCGYCYCEKKTVIVPDVEQFPGHIACSSLSKSEIVVPIWNNNGRIEAVLDIDSDKFDDFNSEDAFWLEKLVKII
jgi:L-methionine (R)-S-oxide reductase